jgi:geranylgeranyl diphosphate synthase type I
MFGDAETVGKPVGSDLVEGKFTVLIHHTLNTLSPADSDSLKAALGNPNLSGSEVSRFQRLIEASGARRKVEEMIEERMEDARTVLQDLDLERSGAEFLEGMIDYLRGRQR